MKTTDAMAEEFYAISPSLAKKLIARLSPFEKIALRLHAIGFSLQEIADYRGISRTTARSILEKIAAKTGVCRRKLPAMYFASRFDATIMLAVAYELETMPTFFSPAASDEEGSPSMAPQGGEPPSTSDPRSSC